MSSHLMITALGANEPGTLNEISQAILEAGCNIEDSRMIVRAGTFAILLMVEGNWNEVAKLESALANLEQRLGATIQSLRSEPREPNQSLLPYAADVVSMDHPGIVHQLADFFSTRGIAVEELVTNSYRASHTGTPMFSVHMEVDIPSEVHISELREAFMDFCDEYNLDAVLEPVKS